MSCASTSFVTFLSEAQILATTVSFVFGLLVSQVVRSMVESLITPLISAIIGNHLSDLQWVIRRTNSDDNDPSSTTVENPTGHETVTSETDNSVIALTYGKFLVSLISAFIQILILFIFIKFGCRIAHWFF